jgi:hypothetical protein
MGEWKDSCRVVVEGNVRDRIYVGELDIDGRIT